jgi:FkbM family methyltransferase
MKTITKTCPAVATSPLPPDEVLQFDTSTAVEPRQGRGLARYLKDAAKRILRAQHYRVVYAPKGPIAGLNLIDDLRQIITSPKPVCFDVGANEGQTIELLQETFRNPKIYSFEPAREIFAKLTARKFRSEVFLNNFAFGSENGRMPFNNYEDSCLSSFLELDGNLENRFRGVHIKNREVVEVRTMDSFVQENGITRIDLLKVDTQGFDFEVLRGATKTLKSNLIGSVLVELNFVKMYQSQSDAHLIVQFLTEQNLQLVDYYEKFRQNHTLAWCSALFTTP